MRSLPKAFAPLLAAACLLVYWTSLDGAFVWDDETQLVKNPAIRSLDSIPSAFTTGFWSFASGGTNKNNFYRPMQTVLYTLGYAAGETSPRAYHAISLAMHTAATLALFWLCLELGIVPLWAMLAGLLFAVHPIHTEAVSWIAGIPDVACGAFFFASAAAFLRGGKKWVAASLVLFLLALLSKEMAITLPLVLLLIAREDRLKRVAPYLGVVAVYIALRVNALGFLTIDQAQVTASLWDWLTLGVWAWGAYAWFAIVPYPLSAYHTVPLHFGDRMIGTGGAALVLSALAIAAWRLYRRLPELALSITIFTVLLIPVFYFPGISTALIAERYLYIPSAAAILLLVSLLRHVGWGYRAAYALAAAFAILTLVRASAWTNNLSLYTATVATSPDAAHIRLNLAATQLELSDPAASRANVEASLAIFAQGKYPQTTFDRYRAEVAMGVLESNAGNHDAARRRFEQAIAIDPNGDWAHLYLGRLKLEVDGDFPGGIASIRKAVQLSAVNEVARDYLGVALVNQGNYRDAAAAFEDALRINPGYGPARQHLDLVRGEMQKTRLSQ